MQRKSAVLACKRLPATYSLDDLSHTVDNIYENYAIDKVRVTAAISNNGSDLQKAFKEFGLDSSDCFSKGKC